MYNLSSAQGPRFVEIVNEMIERTKKLGPSPLKKKKDLKPAEV
jgi:coenzyme F420-reducing hydrogenase delta subunit